ncbi:MAG: hypothetical protein AB7E47_07670, partial [Desulfovibrionaceae bacterium]
DDTKIRGMERGERNPLFRRKKGFTLSSLLPPAPLPLSSLFPQKLLAGAIDTVRMSKFPRQTADEGKGYGWDKRGPQAGGLVV